MSGSSSLEMQIGDGEKLATFRIIEHGTRQEIILAVMNPEVRLGDKHPISGNTLLYELLNQVTNGDEIVLQKLDTCVGTTNDDPNSANYSVLIDQKCLVGDDPRSLSMLGDLLSFPRDATVRILEHPVITTFVKRRWPALLFGVMSGIYILFVLNFSAFLLLMFSSSGSMYGIDCDKVVLPPSCTGDCTRTCYRKTAFSDSFKYGDYTMFIAECFFIVNAMVLLFQEIWQFGALGKDYVREAENWFEIFIIILALVTFFMRDESLQSIMGSVAVCCAWVEIIFMFGRIPFEGGTFNIMFYATAKRVILIAIGLVLMVIALAVSFYVLHYDLEANDSPFTNMRKSIVISFSWLLDGADVETIWEASTRAKKNAWLVELITLFLLFIMMIFGSLILINLIVAAIIMDFGWVRDQALETSLRNRAHSLVQARAGREFLGRIFKIIFVSKEICEEEKEERFRALEVIVCVHRVCKCDQKKLDKETADKLKKILEDRD